jgi:hypothetical protein
MSNVQKKKEQSSGSRFELLKLLSKWLAGPLFSWESGCYSVLKINAFPFFFFFGKNDPAVLSQ